MTGEFPGRLWNGGIGGGERGGTVFEVWGGGLN